MPSGIREENRRELSGLRFRGLSAGTREFFEALEQDPCPRIWPGGHRVAYAAHVLSPFKAIASDLGRLLDDLTPRVTLDARVGGSLSWTGKPDLPPEDCPVRLIRAWDGDASPDSSPVLYVCFTAGGIEVGVWAAGGDPDATRRVVDALHGGDASLRARTAELVARGWLVTGVAGPGAEPSAPPCAGDLGPWNVFGGLRVFRALDWSEWLHEPALVVEFADRFRELLPLFDRMRGVEDAVRRADDAAAERRQA